MLVGHIYPSEEVTGKPDASRIKISLGPHLSGSLWTCRPTTKTSLCAHMKISTTVPLEDTDRHNGTETGFPAASEKSWGEMTLTGLGGQSMNEWV